MCVRLVATRQALGASDLGGVPQNRGLVSGEGLGVVSQSCLSCKDGGLLGACPRPSVFPNQDLQVGVRQLDMAILVSLALEKGARKSGKSRSCGGGRVST